MITRLVWLRNDLRITDNKALHAACSHLEAQVITVFIATPIQWQKHGISSKQIAFIYANLLLLEKALVNHNIPFVYHEGTDFDASVKWLQNYCYKKHVNEIFYNCEYGINEIKRDKNLAICLGSQVICKSFDDSLLLAPGSVLNKHLQMYKVYTPFRKAFIHKFKESKFCSLPPPQIRNNKVLIKKSTLSSHSLHRNENQIFPAGEQEATKRLSIFLKNKIQSYIKLRNFPSINGTSCLSPYLRIGVLSPRQCINYLRIEYPNFLENTSTSIFCWFNEFIWREFYHHLIVAYPFLCMNKSLIAWTDNIFWNQNDEALEAWQHGLTGYPIIDAAMRQLNTIGWMHNRLRMISASFLVKDLFIDWRKGEQYFMSHLLDGDLAANNGGWQWAASTGVDAVPYFRIFNPTTQGIRFDQNGIFIRTWLPELYDVPDKYIHNPHMWIKNNRGVLKYPFPIVKHKQARQKTLIAFHNAKTS